LKKFPAEVVEMQTNDAWILFDHWRQAPPEHESLSFVATGYGWQPPHRDLTDVEKAEELERKYRSGHYLRPDQIAGQLGGLIRIKPGDKVAGVGPMPWPELQLPKDKG
jgi:hypothetical protein